MSIKEIFPGGVYKQDVKLGELLLCCQVEPSINCTITLLDSKPSIAHKPPFCICLQVPDEYAEEIPGRRLARVVVPYMDLPNIPKGLWHSQQKLVDFSSSEFGPLWIF